MKGSHGNKLGESVYGVYIHNSQAIHSSEPGWFGKVKET